MHIRYRLIVFAILMTIAVLSAYREVGDCEFIGFDDDLYVSENEYVQQGLTFESIKWAFTASHASTWQPLVWISYMIESELLGHEIEPWLFHWTNLVIHLINSLLLLYLLYLMTYCFWPSLFVSAIFALHPVHTESVVWVAERKDVLSTLFFMLTLIFYVKYTRTDRTRPFLAAFTLSFILGLMAKPMLITVPVILLLLDYWPLYRIKTSILPLIREKLFLLVPVVISSVVTFIVQKSGGSVASLETLPIVERIANVPVFYMQYFFKLFWPHPLSVLYLHPGMPSTIQIISSSLFVLSVSIIICRYRKSAPFLFIGWLWFLVSLLPVIGLVGFGLHGIADRFLYIPAIGIYTIAAWSAFKIYEKTKSREFAAVLAGLAIALIALAGCLTNRQVEHWKTNISLFYHAINATKDNWAMHNCLGAAKDRAGDLHGALQEFRIAAELNSTRPRLTYNIGCTLQKMGLLDEAINSYRATLDLHPDHLKARYNLAVALGEKMIYEEALSEYGLIIEKHPDHLMTYNNIGTLYTKQGELELAFQNYRKALDIDPDYIKARYNVGALLFQMGQYDAAAKEFVTILKKNPDHYAARQSLKLLLEKIHLQQSDMK